VNETFELTKETLIIDWQDAQDLLLWDDFGKFLNQEFRIEVSKEEWKLILTPETKKTIWDVCQFLAKMAIKEKVRPVKILGQECLSAAVFLTLKKNLQKKGVDVSGLKPSTLISEFLEEDKNYSPLIEEATLTGVRTFDKLEFGQLKTERILKYFVDRFFPNLIYKRPIETGKVKTFRDLVERIIENKELGTTTAKKH